MTPLGNNQQMTPQVQDHTRGRARCITTKTRAQGQERKRGAVTGRRGVTRKNSPENDRDEVESGTKLDDRDKVGWQQQQ